MFFHDLLNFVIRLSLILGPPWYYELGVKLTPCMMPRGAFLFKPHVPLNFLFIKGMLLQGNFL